MKIIMTISIILFGSVGGWIGEVMDHGNWLGGWGIILSTLGSFLGVWVGYKASKYIEL